MAGHRIIHLDCDTGIDDAMALLYLLLDERVEIVGISTVFGNISARTAATNCLRLLDLLGRTDIPVAVGREHTITGDDPALAPHVHGADGLGNVPLPPPTHKPVTARGPELLIANARRRPGQVHLLATGPLTNIAAALRIEPRLPSLVDGITIMGGAADAPGNQTPAAEANILHDPEAARAVLRADWDCTLVPLDVTMRELLTEDHRARLTASQRPAATLVAAATDFYFDFFRDDSFGVRCSPCHDALAAAIAVGDVEPVLAPRIPVEVDCTAGPSRGATICDTRGRYRGFSTPGTGVRVVLGTDGAFPDRLCDRLESAQGAVTT